MIEHVMVQIRTLPSGTTDWLCPVCGRRLLDGGEQGKVVLEPGDTTARHVPPPARPPEQDDCLLSPADLVRLEPFVKWADRHGVSL